MRRPSRLAPHEPVTTRGINSRAGSPQFIQSRAHCPNPRHVRVQIRAGVGDLDLRGATPRFPHNLARNLGRDYRHGDVERDRRGGNRQPLARYRQGTLEPAPGHRRRIVPKRCSLCQASRAGQNQSVARGYPAKLGSKGDLIDPDGLHARLREPPRGTRARLKAGEPRQVLTH